MVVIIGNHLEAVSNYVSSGKITANGGAGTVMANYNNLRLGKTTIYALGATIVPEQTVWNPAANFPDTAGLWSVGGNWVGGQRPGSLTKAVFNVPDAIPCNVTDAAVANRIVIGDNGPGGTLIIKNGGSLVCSSPDEWSAIGYNSNALMIVENGGSVSFGYHLWIGHQPGVTGTLTMNGGTVSVNQMFGLGWSGGTGYANIHGGTLNLTQWNDTESIKGASVLDVAGMGKVVINGDRTVSVGNFVASGKITASGTANVLYSYDSGTGKTTISSGVPLPPPSRSITGIAVNGGMVSLTYETTAGYTYYIEATPSLSPATWTPVPGSTNTATGAPVTFNFPVGSNPMFYRTVLP
jgi:formylmethanofuran dehydrogenase subunit C